MDVRLLTGGRQDPAFNLALDEALLHGRETTVRFYQWRPPGLSLGYFQRPEELSLEPVLERGLVLVRRPTGGGAIAHVEELTFSLTGDLGGPFFGSEVRADYDRVHRVFQRALETLGMATRVRDDTALDSDRPPEGWLCFYKSSGLDLVTGGRKLLGSAQRRTRGRVLHHGSLPLRPNPVTPVAADVATALGRPVAAADLVALLVRAMEREFRVRLHPGVPTADEVERAEELVERRYGNDDWTWRRRL